MRSIDWSKTAFGPVGQWPSSLLTIVNLMLSSSYPISLLWGRELRQLYNDAYVPLVGSLKHPGILGRPFKDGWPETWHVIMDGYELAGHLRGAPHGEQIRLVAVTGYGQDSDRLRAVQAGFDAHLVKPVELNVVAALIDGYRSGVERRLS